jgi:hypothetical protein
MFFSGNGNNPSPIGRAIALAQPGVSGIARLMGEDDGQPLNWTAHRSIITRVGMNHACNFQASQMIGNDVYLYVFGDRLGQAVVSGLSMATQCYCGEGGATVRADRHGIENTLQWYLERRVSQNRKPVTLTIGASTHLTGILVNFEVDTQSDESFLMRYTMTIQTMPEKL